MYYLIVEKDSNGSVREDPGALQPAVLMSPTVPAGIHIALEDVRRNGKTPET